MDQRRTSNFNGDEGLGKIPVFLYREADAVPFDRCDFCSQSLDDGRRYVIVKDYFFARCVLEFAICDACQIECQSQFSTESCETLRTFRARTEELYSAGKLPGGCSQCAKPPELLDRYQVRCQCQYDRMQAELTYCCAPCEDRIQDALSPETRGEIDRFFRRGVPGVPEIGVELGARVRG